MVRARAGELIDGFAGRAECDVVTELAVPLPAQVFLTLFGLPLEDRDRLIAWKEGLLTTSIFQAGEPPSERATRVGAELLGLFGRPHPSRPGGSGAAEDLLGRLLAEPRRRTAQRGRDPRPVVPVRARQPGNGDVGAEHRVRGAGEPSPNAAAADRRGPGRHPGRGRGTPAVRRAGGLSAAHRHPGRRGSGQLIPAGSYVTMGWSRRPRPRPTPDPDMIDFPGARSGTWRSAAARIAASARTWPGWRCGWRWRNGAAGYRSTSWPRA